MNHSDTAYRLNSAGRRGLLVIAALIAAEVTVVFFTESEVVGAAAVAAVLSVAVVSGFLRSAIAGDASVPVIKGGSFFLLLFAIGIYGTLLGLLKRNDIFYWAADVYHWWFELVIVAYLVYVIVQRIPQIAIVEFLCATSVFLGCISLLFIFLGSVGLTLGGGHIIPSLGMWRFEGGKGFPLLMAVPLFSSFRSRSQLSLNWRFARYVGACLLMAVLVFTFKRTMWLTFMGAAFLMFAPKRVVKYAFIFTPIFCVSLVIIYRLFPNTFIEVLSYISDWLTYNPSYTVEETLGERAAQIYYLMPYMRSIPGYGFGASFFTYWPGNNTMGVVHYIHNNYVYNLLQLGYGGFAAFLFFYVGFGWRLWKVLGTDNEREWMARGAFAGIAAMLVSGLTLNSTHTVFNGLIVGLGLVAVNLRFRNNLNKADLRPATSRSGD